MVWAESEEDIETRLGNAVIHPALLEFQKPSFKVDPDSDTITLNKAEFLGYMQRLENNHKVLCDIIDIPSVKALYKEHSECPRRIAILTEQLADQTAMANAHRKDNMTNELLDWEERLRDMEADQAQYEPAIRALTNGVIEKLETLESKFESAPVASQAISDLHEKLKPELRDLFTLRMALKNDVSDRKKFIKKQTGDLRARELALEKEKATMEERERHAYHRGVQDTEMARLRNKDDPIHWTFLYKLAAHLANEAVMSHKEEAMGQILGHLGRFGVDDVRLQMLHALKLGSGHLPPVGEDLRRKNKVGNAFHDYWMGVLVGHHVVHKYAL
jgi:hypothetical protein